MMKKHFQFFYFVVLLGMFSCSKSSLLFASEGKRSPIQIQEFVTNRGIKAWFVEDHTIPVLSLSISFRAGSIYDAPEKMGTSTLLASMYVEGAGSLNAEMLSAELEDHGIQVDIDNGPDLLTIFIRTTSEHSGKAFDLLRMMLTSPQFKEESFKKLKSIHLATLANLEKVPSHIADQKIHAHIYPNHPYGRSHLGTLGSVKKITIDDIRAFHKQHVTRQNLIVSVCGDITQEALKKKIDLILGDLPSTQAPHTPIQEADFHPLKQDIYMETHHPQSTVSFCQNGLKVKDEDYMKLQTLNVILADGLHSRLFQEMRVKKGLVYGIGVYPAPREFGASYCGTFASDQSYVQEALHVLRREWRRLQESGVTNTELENAKTNMIGEFPLNLTSSRSIVNLLANYQYQGLDPDYVNRRTQIIRSLKLEDMNAFAKRFYDPENLHFVIVGQGIKGSLPTSK